MRLGFGDRVVVRERLLIRELHHILAQHSELMRLHEIRAHPVLHPAGFDQHRAEHLAPTHAKPKQRVRLGCAPLLGDFFGERHGFGNVVDRRFGTDVQRKTHRIRRINETRERVDRAADLIVRCAARILTAEQVIVTQDLIEGEPVAP